MHIYIHMYKDRPLLLSIFSTEYAVSLRGFYVQNVHRVHILPSLSTYPATSPQKGLWSYTVNYISKQNGIILNLSVIETHLWVMVADTLKCIHLMEIYRVDQEIFCPLFWHCTTPLLPLFFESVQPPLFLERMGQRSFLVETWAYLWLSAPLFLKIIPLNNIYFYLSWIYMDLHVLYCTVMHDAMAIVFIILIKQSYFYDIILFYWQQVLFITLP